MSLRPVPSLKVEVAFDTDPNDVPAVDTLGPSDWTDITGWTRGIASLDRSKRTVELDRFEAGTGKITVDNSDGRFSPTNASSPYAGRIIPYRMIRITATWAGTSYPVWQGYVERWPTRWLDPAQGLAELDVVDALAIASQIGMSGAYTATVLLDGPTHYYPMSDDSTATQAANQSTTPQENAVVYHNSVPAGDSDAATFGSSFDLPGADAQSGLGLATTGTYPNKSGYGLRLPFVYLTWSSWSFEVWVSAEFGADSGQILWAYDANAGNLAAGSSIISLWMDGSGKVTLQMTTPDGVGATLLATTFDIRGQGPVNIAVTWGSEILSLYVYGFIGATGVASPFVGTRPSVVQLGSIDTNGAGTPAKYSDNGTGRAFTGTIAHLSIYPYEMTDTQVADHFSAGLVPLHNQLSSDRAQSLLDWSSWPPTLVDIQTGKTTMQDASGLANRSLLDNLQDIADTENGTLFTTSDGKLALYPRSDRMLKASPSVVFGSNVAAGEIPFQLDSLLLDYDPTLIYDDVQVQRRDASTAHVYDADAIRQFFARTLQRPSLASTDADAAASASWLLDRYSHPTLRAETIVIEAGSLGPDVTSLWPQLLALDINDRVRLNHRPMNQPTVTLDGYVDQLSYDVDPDTGIWRVTIQISPALRDYWRLADTAGGVHTWDAQSVLGSTTRLSY